MNRPKGVGKTIVATSGVNACLNENEEFQNFVRNSLTSFISGNWGDTADDSVARNNAVMNGEEDQVFAVYNIPDNLKGVIDEKSIWIVTEWDKSVTTILFPSDY